jgi:hypothetical protein
MTTKRQVATKVDSTSPMDAEQGHFESAPTFSQPAFASAQLLKIMRAALVRTGLDLSGLTILTEAATGAYCVTPVIAALANAVRVYALTRPSRHGSITEVKACTIGLATFAGVADRIEIIETIDNEVLARADIVTNSGHLRPLARSIISKLTQHCVIALMFETWEFRTSDIDLAAAREYSIPIVGVNERHPAVDVFSYLGPLCVNMLHEAGVPVYGSRIALLCDNDFGSFIARSLTGHGADIRSFSDVATLERGHWDAIVLALQPTAGPRIDALGAAHIARVAPTAILVQLWGDADRAAIAATGVSVWPPQAPAPGHMGVLLSAIGPEPIIRLQTGGLRAAEWVRRGKAIEAGGIAEIL